MAWNRSQKAAAPQTRNSRKRYKRRKKTEEKSHAKTQRRKGKTENRQIHRRSPKLLHQLSLAVIKDRRKDLSPIIFRFSPPSICANLRSSAFGSVGTSPAHPDLEVFM